MAGPLVVVLIGVGMLVGVLAGGLGRVEPAPVSAALADEARRVGRWSWGGLAMGVVAAAAVGQWDRLGRGLLLAAPVLGLAVLAGTIGGELAVTGPTAGTRRAGLRARRVGDYVPRRAAVMVAGAAAALVAVAVGAILAGSDDDLGRAGRVLTTSCSPDTSSSRGPWPGWFYSGPLLAVVGMGLVLAVVALRAVVSRPRMTIDQASVPVGGDSTSTCGRAGPMDADASAMALDEALRRWSAKRVVAACAMVVALPLLGMASVGAVVLAGAECLPAGGRAAGAALVLVAPLAAVLLGWSVHALLIPAGLRAGSGGVGRA